MRLHLFSVAIIAGRRDAAPPEKEWLWGAFGLTRAEAKAAFAVSEGSGVVEAARNLNVLPNTIKTHLHRVFDKAATNSQVELVRLLAPIGLIIADLP